MKRILFLISLVFIITGCLYPPSTSLHQVFSTENSKSEATEDPLAIKAKQTIDALISPTPNLTKEAGQLATMVYRTLEAMKPSATSTLSSADLMATNVSGTIAALKSEIEKNSTTLTAQAVSTATLAPPPTLYVIPTAQPTVPTVSVTPCDRLSFVTDITVPDGTIFKPGESFQKIWRIKNVGSCTWTPSYQFTFVDGYQMSAPVSISIGRYVGPGDVLDVGVNMVAPATPGKYSSYWRLRNDKGALFGMGRNDGDAVWVEINVAQSEESKPASYGCTILDISRNKDSFNVSGRGTVSSIQILITVKNTGNQTWLKDDIDIAYLSGSKEYFDQLRYDLPYNVGPNQTFTFETEVGGLNISDSSQYSTTWGLDNNGSIICTFSFTYGF